MPQASHPACSFIFKCENLMWHLGVIYLIISYLPDDRTQLTHYFRIGCGVIWRLWVSKAETLRSAFFFQAVIAQSGLLEGKHRQQAAGEGERERRSLLLALLLITLTIR